MWILLVIGIAIVALAHTAPAPFVLDLMAGERVVWHMPRGGPPTIYLTYDDGPNPTTTPDLLDRLAHEGVHATFFIIDQCMPACGRSTSRSSAGGGCCGT